MLSTLYSEFRKLISIRSTYIVSALSLLIIGGLSFYGTGLKGGPHFSPHTLQAGANDALGLVGIFVGIIAILIITHEYRYNTIAYTLTESNNRMKVLLSKMIIGAGYALLMALLAIGVSMSTIILGVHIAGNELGPQILDAYSLLWKSAAYMIGTAWFGMALGFLFRSQVMAIVAYFVVPTIEALLQALLKVNKNYLPSSSQEQILQYLPMPGSYSPLASLGVFALYLVGAWIVASVLFVKRDAN